MAGARLYPALLGLLQPALPFILGLSLGCSLSLLQVSWMADTEGPCVSGAGGPGGHTHPLMKDVEPRVVPYRRRAHPPHRKVFRTRFIQSELGFRERLAGAVLSSRSTLNSLAVAVNQTLSPHVGRLVFFSGARGSKALAGMEVVAVGDERPAWLMYHALRHLQQHFLSTYDWYFLSQDNSYTNGYRLEELLARLSPGPPAYLGQPMEFIGGQESWRYCSGGAGFLLSRALLLRLGPHLDFCRSDILSSRGDEWLGRCLQDTLGIPCTSHYQGLRYTSYTLPRNLDVDRLEGAVLGGAISVHSVRDPTLMYKLQKKLSQERLHRTYHKIQQLQNEIGNLSVLTPEGAAKGRQWPLGVTPPFSPTSRFDLLTWDYFTETHSFSCPDGAPKCLLRGPWLLDVQQVVEEAMEQLNLRCRPWISFRKLRLLNGYRRFDPTRGTEYILELLLDAATIQGRAGVITKRVTLLRPLSLVEILPMPYVTEATRVQLLLPLMPAHAEATAGFLDALATNLLDPQENVALTVLLVYDGSAAGHEDDPFQEARGMMAELERRYPTLRLEITSVRAHVPSQVGLVDLASKKHPVGTLFFLLNVWSEVSADALNRCRMNAISAWQVYSLVPYQEYSPDVSNLDSTSSTPPEFLRNGRFDRLASAEFCFYNSDFMGARKRMTADVGAREEEEGVELLELFLQHSELHVFRAVEPALVQRFSLGKCGSHLSGDGYHRCVTSSLESLGSRVNLAMAFFSQNRTAET
ncbi:chondroitin sulfate glucuronyltransferase-like [Gastrophryne carolinensis]